MYYAYKIIWMFDNNAETQKGIVYGDSYADAVSHISKSVGEDDLVEILIYSTDIECMISEDEFKDILEDLDS